MKIDTDKNKIEELLTRGVDEVIQKENLEKKLLSGKKLRVKLGIDPTSKDIHIGRSVPLLKLRDFQKLGHQVIFIVGDFTGIIGDTSDKDSERPMLTKEEVEENKKTYFEQVGKVIDLDAAEFRYNSEWLSKLTYEEIGEHANLFSISDFISRDNIRRRLDAGKRISLREVLYPLMQGYDSVAVAADVELGGTDQRFNLLAGRTMQPNFNQKPQEILMTELINGTDGRKMSSSWGNTITITIDPEDMYGKAMSVSDSEILVYFEAATRIPMVEISNLKKELENGSNPKDSKMKLAKELVTMYHSEKEAISAEKSFIETFQKRKAPEDILEIIPSYTEALVASGIIKSKTELRRLLDAGGVRDLDTGEKLTAIPSTVKKPTTLKIGKRRFVRLLP